jgi:hypothetical protein
VRKGWRDKEKEGRGKRRKMKLPLVNVELEKRKLITMEAGGFAQSHGGYENMRM